MSLPKNRLFDHPFVLSMGPQRAGTSWLDRYLRARGDVCLPAEVKEIFFFDRHYHRGETFYQDHFNPGDSHRVVMEVSTTSFDAADAPRHVHEVFGSGITLLCPLRHPVARSYSLYLHYKRYGMVAGSLQTACRDHPQILESSRYAKHLQRWYEHYPKDAIQIVFQEDLEQEYGGYVSHVCALLGLPEMKVPPEVRGRYNETTRAPIPALASLAQKGADFLRRYRLYAVINFAKAIGLKGLIFGRGGQGGRDDVDQGRVDDIAWLHQQLDGEVEKLEALIGPVEAWKDLDL